MSGKNPFDLNNKKKTGGAPAAKLRKPLTTEEKREKLQGYIQVPEEFWPNVAYGKHVRYVETKARGGEFRGGGFVVRNPFDTKVKGGPTEKRFIKFQNNFAKASPTHKEWIAAYEDIAYLYVKGTGAELAIQKDLRKAVESLNHNITRLAEFVKKRRHSGPN